MLIARLLIWEMPQEHIVRLAKARWANRTKNLEFPVERFGEVAYICAPNQYRSAREYGNKWFPVTAVFDPEHETDSGRLQRRWCIIRQAWPVAAFDMIGFAEEINAAEASARGLSLDQLCEESLNWGGPGNMLVSAQGAGYESVLSKETILALVRKHLESGIVS